MFQNILEVKLTREKIIIFLGLIIFSGIIFRLIFSHFELPLNSDNLQYFLFAIDHSILGQENSYQIHNQGWPYFVSFFFSVFNSNNYMDFMALQKIISIIISSLTAIPIYFLGKKFFRKEFALLGSCLFVFEPRIVQNSTFGIADPLYIIGLTIAIVLILSSKKNTEIFAFIVLGLSIAVRSEGLFLIPAFIIVYLLQNKISKKSIKKILISLIILTIILSLIILNQSIENSKHGLFFRVNSGINEIYTSPETESAGSPINLLMDGLVNFIKFLGWSQIPIWIIFVPAGLIILLITKNKITVIILTLSFFITIPILYAFTFTNDTRYLFTLYPIFTLISLFTITKIDLKNKSVIKIGIIVGLIISSSIFLIWKDVDNEYEEERFNFIKEIYDKQKIINNFGYEASYIVPATLETVDFPISYNEILNQGMKVVNIPKFDSFDKYMLYVKDNKLTHLVIKENNSYKFLDNIFKNENEYQFLIKEYNSSFDDKLQIKIFKINYEYMN